MACIRLLSLRSSERLWLYPTRANYGLTIGNFEMNIDTSEVRFKTSIDRYLPGITQVAAGDDTPAEAIAELEAGE